MNSIRVLLAVEPRLLRDALHAVLVRHKRLVVFDEESRTIDVLIRAREHNVDVVILTPEPTVGAPPLVSRLLTEFPNILVVGLNPHEQCARVYRSNAKVRILLDLTASALIRAVSRGASQRAA